MLNNLDPSSPDFIANPLPYYRELLASPPFHVDFGIRTAIIARHAQAVTILRDHKRFSSELDRIPGTRNVPSLFGSQNFTFLDPPAHTRLRRLVAPSFTPSVTAGWESFIRSHIQELLDEMAKTGRVEFVTAFASKLPFLVMCTLLRWPVGDRDMIARMMHHAHEIWALSPQDDLPPHIVKAREEERVYFTNVIEERRKNLGDDLISRLIAVQDEGGAVTTEELRGLVTTLIVGGIGTTSHLLGSSLYELLREPDLMKKIHSNPGAIPGAVEEALRCDPPVVILPRFALADAALGEITIRAGEAVYIMVGACNRDPEVFYKPDQFDIDRKPNDHLSFGRGLHLCTGAPMARIQARLALEMLFERFPNIQLENADAPPTQFSTTMSREVTELFVLTE